MDKPVPSLSLAHPKPAAERFLTEMLEMGRWDHLFQVVGVKYPIMPKDFYFNPQETIVSNGKQLEGDDALIIFFARYSDTKFSTMVVGMRKEEQHTLAVWQPNSLSIDLYIRSERLRTIWGAERCVIPVMRIPPKAK